MRIVRAAGLLALLLAGCSLELGVPATVQISCANNAQCPEGSICDTNVGRCVASETPSLRLDVPDELTTRYTRSVPFTVQIVSANADAVFDVQLEFRLLDDGDDAWLPLALATDSQQPGGLVGSPSGTTYRFVWDALADAVAANGLGLARVDLDADGQVADPIVLAADVVIRAIARNASGTVRSVPAESAPFSIGNAAPVATILASIGESDVINVIVGLTDSSADVCGFELQFRGPDGVWRNAALRYGNTTSLGCSATVPFNASVGWDSRQPLYAPDVQPTSTPQGIGNTTVPSASAPGRITLRARAYDSAEASASEQHWGIWSPPRVLTRVVNQTSPVVVAAVAPRTLVAGGTGPVHVRYSVVDAESDPVDVAFDFSNDAGTTWQRCEEYAFAMSEGTSALATGPLGNDGTGGVQHLFSWDPSRANARIAQSTLVRLTVDDRLSAPTVSVLGLGAPTTPSGLVPHDAFAHPLFELNLLRSNGSQAGEAEDVAIADFDNDGDKDLVFAKPEVVTGNSLSVLANTGTTVPWPQSHITGSAYRVVAGNFLGNPTRLSLVGVTQGGAATLWAGNGAMGFGVDTSFTIGATPYQALARDLDNDGDDDLVVARDEDGSNATLLVFMNTGAAGSRFSSTPVFTRAFPVPISVAVGDVDMDAIADVVVVGLDRAGFVLLGDGSGGFAQAVTFACEHDRDSDTVAIGEVNGDGFPDIVNLGTFEVIFQLGSGGPGAVSYEEVRVDGFASSFGTGAFADLNGDGLTDIVSSGEGLSSFVVLLTAFDTVTGMVSARAGEVRYTNLRMFADDLDFDGVAELVGLTGNGLGAAGVMRVDGPSTLGGQSYQQGGSIAPTTSVGFPLVATLDSDGVPDLMFIDSSLRLHRGLGSDGVGDGAYAVDEEPSFIGGQNATVIDAKAVDLNSDGALDIVLLAQEQVNEPTFHFELYLGWIMSRPLQGVADARFEPLQRFLVSATGGADSAALQVADFDADGRPDAAYVYNADYFGDQFTLGVAFNKGTPTFDQQDATYALGTTGRQLDRGYVGDDPLPDLMLVMPATNQVRLFNSATLPVNRANPFAITNITVASNPVEARFADLNWDGVTDIWLRYGTSIEMRNGIAGGGFGSAIDYFPNAQMGSVAFHDVTLDGVNDFLFLAYPFNDQGGIAAGTAPLGVPANQFASNPTTFLGEGFGSDMLVAARDVNCDGALDLAVSTISRKHHVLTRERDLFAPQLSLSAPPYRPGTQRALASLGLAAPFPQHPWQIAGAAPCADQPRWEDDLRAWRAGHGVSPRFRVLAPARWLGGTERYVKAQVGTELRRLRTSRFTPALDLSVVDAPRGLVATHTVARARRASVVPGKLKVYRQTDRLLTASEVPLDSLHTHPDAPRLLPRLASSAGVIDVVQRRWSWEQVPLDADGNLATGTGRRYVYDAGTGRVDILTDAGGLYVVVEDL